MWYTFNMKKKKLKLTKVFVKDVKLPEIGLKPIDVNDPRHKAFLEELAKATAEGKSGHL